MNHDNENKTIKIFNQKEIKTHWDEVREKWWFSVVDIIGVLTESENPQVYWRVLKKRLLDEGNETVTNCNGLKMMAPDGKMRMTDVLDTEGVLRLVQSIPSPKAEPFKLESRMYPAFLFIQTPVPCLSLVTLPEEWAGYRADRAGWSKPVRDAHLP